MTRTPTEHAVAFVIALASMFVMDKFVITPFIKFRVAKSDLSSTRWFLLHFVANFVGCVTGLNCLYTTFIDPYNAANSVKYPDDSAFGPSSAWPLTTAPVTAAAALEYSLTSSVMAGVTALAASPSADVVVQT